MKVNTLVEKVLYQRGQILTWPRKSKEELFKRHNIRVVVNLWPKIDNDLADMDLDWYFHIPLKSNDALKSKVKIAAKAVAAYLDGREGVSALILCEAGVTRSVFFSALVIRSLLGLSPHKAGKYVAERVKTNRMKPFMKEYLGL